MDEESEDQEFDDINEDDDLHTLVTDANQIK